MSQTPVVHPPRTDHAVVIGASMAGLLAARVLAGVVDPLGGGEQPGRGVHVPRPHRAGGQPFGQGAHAVTPNSRAPFPQSTARSQSSPSPSRCNASSWCA